MRHHQMHVGCAQPSAVEPTVADCQHNRGPFLARSGSAAPARRVWKKEKGLSEAAGQVGRRQARTTSLQR